MPSLSESFSTQVAVMCKPTLLLPNSAMLMLVTFRVLMAFPLIENVPVPGTKPATPFKRKRISKEENCVTPLSYIPSKLVSISI